MSNKVEAFAQVGIKNTAITTSNAANINTISTGQAVNVASRADTDVHTDTSALNSSPHVHKNVSSRYEVWRRFISDALLGAMIPVAVLIIWQLIGSLGFVSPTYLPTPLLITKAFWKLTVSGEIFHHLGISIGRAGFGFFVGGVLGLLFGVITGLFRRVQYLFDPSIQVLRLIPHLAIAPLIILWFGFGEISKAVIIMNGAFFPLYINTFMGIRNVDNKLFEVAQVLNFSSLKRISRLILPAALPSILLGVRLSLAVSWIGLVVAELIGSQSGVGFLINEAKQNSNTDIIFVGIIIFAVVGKLIDSCVRFLEHKWLDWRDTYQG